MRVIWQSEIDPYASAVLKKHWPHVPNHGDIRTITAAVERPDVLCGGFPCQDISNAGKRAGIDGERSGLWSEFARVIGELRPDYVLVENVAALLGRGLERVLGDLAALGFDAEWHCIPASAVGAPHRRDRIWLVADYQSRNSRTDVADTAQFWRVECWGQQFRGDGAAQRYLHHWQPEPDLGRVAHGIPARVDRLRCLGNAIVPQIAEIIGRAILNSPPLPQGDG